MSQHKATVKWQLSGENFVKGRYSRAHVWSFDGGVEVPASASPDVVRAPYSEAAAVDPEEAYVASLSSCHMLTFLYVAAKAGFEVLSYRDDAVGTLSKNDQGALWVSTVVLAPQVEYGSPAPSAAVAHDLHEQAHSECFVANSVKTAVSVLSSPRS